MLKTCDYNYELDEKFIAQTPAEKREMSKMMVLNRKSGSIENRHFFDIINYLDESDILVLNDTKVIQARLLGRKIETGANIEVFLLKAIDDSCNENIWQALVKPAKRVRSGTLIELSDDFRIEVVGKYVNDKFWVKLLFDKDKYTTDTILGKYGQIPLPPYIERKMSSDEIKKLDRDRYQTVFAKNKGSVAAPTAGLHFTKEILEDLGRKGVQICYVTLNVGLGTFRPVKCENILEHEMESESFEISEKTCEIINCGIREGKKLTSVGTTTVRTLETTMLKYGKILPIKDESKLFIYPSFKFQIVDKLLTNFHLPKSTLLMLVSAFAGKDFIFNAYKNAIKNNYKFYSYGDCMFIE